MTKKSPSSRTLFGLNGMIFFLSDVRPGIGPFLAIYLKSFLGWSSDKVGIALGTMDATAAVCQIPSGILVDSVRFKRFLIFLAVSAIALASGLILGFPKLSAVVLAQILIGIATAILPPSIAAVTLGLVGRKPFPKRISINETWAHIGNVATAGIVALLAYRLGHPWILYMVIVFAALSVLMLQFINPKEINHEMARELPEENEESSPLPIWQFLKKSKLLLFCVSIFFFYLSNAAQLPLVGQRVSQGRPLIAALFMGGSIILGQAVMIAVAYSSGFFMKLVGRKPIFLTALGVLPIRALLYTLTDRPFFYLAIQLLDGIGAGLVGVIGVVTVSDIAKESGRFNFSLGMIALSQGIGASSSNVLSGFIANKFGFNMAFVTLASLAILGFIYHILFMPETKNNKN